MRIGEAGMYTYDLTSQAAAPAPPAPGTMPVDMAAYAPPPAQLYPISQPVVIQEQSVPRPTTMVMPTMTGTAQVSVPNPRPDILPSDLLKPLPSIVDNQPSVVAQCDSFAGWVDQNPLMAAGILLGFAYIMFKKR